MTLRDRVRELAHAQGLTLRDLAAIAFDDAPTERAAERRLDRLLASGRGARLSHLEIIADSLEVAVAELLEGVD